MKIIFKKSDGDSPIKIQSVAKPSVASHSSVVAPSHFRKIQTHADKYSPLPLPPPPTPSRNTSMSFKSK